MIKDILKKIPLVVLMSLTFILLGKGASMAAWPPSGSTVYDFVAPTSNSSPTALLGRYYRVGLGYLHRNPKWGISMDTLKAGNPRSANGALYCAERGNYTSTEDNNVLRLYSYVEIVGNTAKAKTYGGTSNITGNVVYNSIDGSNTAITDASNARLSYIFRETSRAYGYPFEDGYGTDPTYYSARQLAFWTEFTNATNLKNVDSWYTKVGKSLKLRLNCQSSSVQNKDVKDRPSSGKYYYLGEAKKLVDGATNDAEASIAHSYGTAGKTVTSNSVAGPFKVTFSGTISSIVVKNTSGGTISSGISFCTKSDGTGAVSASSITSGTDFYIKNTTSNTLGSMTINVSKTCRVLKMWFYDCDIGYKGTYSGDTTKHQEFVYVQTGTKAVTATTNIKITIKNQMVTITLNKVDSKDSSKKLANVEFKLQHKGTFAKATESVGEYTITGWSKNNNADEGTILKTDSNGKIEITLYDDGNPYYALWETNNPNNGYTTTIQNFSASKNITKHVGDTVQIKNNSRFYFDLNADTNNYSSTATITLINEKQPTVITVTKADSKDSSKKLANVEFKLQHKGTFAKATGSVGEYTITGWSKNNNADEGTILKTDSNGKIEITLYDDGNPYYALWETNNPNNGYTTTIQNFSASENITKNSRDTVQIKNKSRFYFDLNASNYSNTASITLKNEKQPTVITVIKADSKDSSKKLANVEFKLLHKRTYAKATGSVGEYTITGWSNNADEGTILKTDSNGEIKIKLYDDGNPYYALWETKNPNNGYTTTIQNFSASKNITKHVGDTVQIYNSIFYFDLNASNYSNTASITLKNEKQPTVITVIKADSKDSSKKLANVEFKLRHKGTFAKATGSVGKYTITGWSENDNADEGTILKTDSNGKIEITLYDDGDPYYALWETKNPNNGYTTTIQNFSASKNITKNDVDTVQIKNNSRFYFDLNASNYSNTASITLKNEKQPTVITVIKADSIDSSKKLANVEFKLRHKGTFAKATGSVGKYTITGWSENDNADEGTILKTDSNGKIEITLYDDGDPYYALWETKNPNNGYSSVYIDSAEVSSNITKKDGDTTQIKNSNTSYYFNLNADTNNYSSTATITLKNQKDISISGYVWIDTKPEKGTYNNFYDSGEQTVDGVIVTLKNKNGSTVTSVTTANGGKYTFEGVLRASQLKDYYVEFDYSGTVYKKYIPAAFNSTTASGIKANGSRAIVQTMPKATSSGGKYIADSDARFVGKATTYTGTDTIKEKTYGLSGNLYANTNNTGLYNASTNTLENINLGIKKVPEATYNITENLAYVKITIKGYTYTYQYGGIGDTNAIAAPTVSWQSSQRISAYTRAIYPSDIVYKSENASENLKVSVVYRMDITNPTQDNSEETYQEKTLYISKLTNTFDTNRYTLNTTSDSSVSNEVSKDFSKWAGSGSTVTYTGDKFNNGLSEKETKTVYIQFDVKDTAIKSILNNPTGIKEDLPTTASATGYHLFQRKDYSWDNNIANTQLHTTKNDTRTSSAPYLIFKLGEQRTISGTAFKDKIVQDNSGRILGDGKYTSDENVAQGVKVELLDASGNVSSLYQTKDNSGGAKEANIIEASVTTGSNGEYKLEGIVPGDYYVRFTYGDGTYKYLNSKGQEVSVNVETKLDNSTKVLAQDYKSTVIKSNIVKNAITNESSVAATKHTWYRSLEGTNYSVAVDNLETRGNINNKNKNSNIIDDSIAQTRTVEKATMDASTPKLSITLENKDGNSAQETARTESQMESNPATNLKDSSGNQLVVINNEETTIKSTYNGFNFGIIEQPIQKAQVEKIITNIKLTTSDNKVIFDGNPQTGEIKSVSDLDSNDKNGGSTYVRAELEETSIYGSTIELTYQIRVTNVSDVNYYNKEYYLYGHANNNKEVTLQVTKVQDYLDETLIYVSSEDSSHQISGDKNITISKWKTLYTSKGTSSGIRSDGNPTSDSVSIMARRILSNSDDDMEIINEVEITGIKSAPNPNDSGATEEEVIQVVPIEVHTNGKEKATTTITPPTGEDKQTVVLYTIAGIVTLVILSIGIIVIKKKVL